MTSANHEQGTDDAPRPRALTGARGHFSAEYLGRDASADRFHSLEAALAYCELREGAELLWTVIADAGRMTALGCEFEGAETLRAAVRGPLVAVWPERFKQNTPARCVAGSTKERTQ
jgi:hypothetical protein